MTTTTTHQSVSSVSLSLFASLFFLREEQTVSSTAGNLKSSRWTKNKGEEEEGEASKINGKEVESIH